MTYALPFYVLKAEGAAVRGERLNAGLVALPAGGEPIVRMLEERNRLAALDGQYASLDLQQFSEQLSAALIRVPNVARAALLRLLAQPFVVATEPSFVNTLPGQEVTDIDALFQRLISPPKRVPQAPAAALKGSRLQTEIKNWLRASKLYSSKVEDLRRNRVVGNYPVDVMSDLFCDFALMNGKLHVIETLDLRGVDRLTPSQHGSAALKGITLAEARSMNDIGQRIAVVQASNYGAARPALKVMDRYADQVWDMNSQQDRSAFAEFVSNALHHDQLPQLMLRAPAPAKDSELQH